MADRATRKKQITARRRAQILKAAMDVFTRKGFASATIPEIAGEAGIAVGTIYLYYPSKHELFISVIKDQIITTPLLDLIYRIPKENIRTVFGQIMRNRVDLVESEDMSRMSSLIGEALCDPELKALWAERFFKPLFTQFEGLYRSLLSPDDPNSIAPAIGVRAVAGFFIGFLMIKLIEGENSPLNNIPREKVTADMANFILHGLIGNKNQTPQPEEVK
jgi:AcrR family transcriptional regulator